MGWIGVEMVRFNLKRKEALFCVGCDCLVWPHLWVGEETQHGPGGTSKARVCDSHHHYDGKATKVVYMWFTWPEGRGWPWRDADEFVIKRGL